MFNSALEMDKLHEECGVFGILGHSEAATLTALGLHALQHRGQASAGIVSYDGSKFHTEKHLGLVGDNFTNRNKLDALPGSMAVGHVRYATTGATILRNVQPLFAELAVGGIAIAHNGNLTNALTIRKKLVEGGAIFQSTSDSEVILHLLSQSRQELIADRFIEALHNIEGAYSIIALSPHSLIAARDPHGIRPLVMGRLNGFPIFCSETCALDIIGAEYVRDVKNGEVIICQLSETGEVSIETRQISPSKPERLCLFEYVYFARPDSVIAGRNVYTTRKQMGINLAKECPADADLVISVPDSGTPAAIGYAEASQLPFEMGIIRNHYVGRTFIEPTQQIRAFGVRLKHSANKAVIAGKRIVLVDDSIVRGTTSLKIVKLLRSAGAAEVHFRIASPPIRHPDFYGIDMPDPNELLANRYDSLAAMTEYIGADSLGFLSIDGLYQAICNQNRDPENPQFTDHYFTGNYPTYLLDYHNKLL